jgi:structural maintenance of chromosome 4
LAEAEEEEQEEPERKKSRKSVEGEDDSEDDDEDEIVQLPKSKGAKRVVRDDDEVQEVKPPRKSSAKPQPTPKRPGPVEKVEEEEISLLEPHLKTTSVMQPPPPEEPSGPKPRLVIHKMVLINFKSYAGRQEIGPFHKV